MLDQFERGQLGLSRDDTGFVDIEVRSSGKLEVFDGERRGLAVSLGDFVDDLNGLLISTDRGQELGRLVDRANQESDDPGISSCTG